MLLVTCYLSVRKRLHNLSFLFTKEDDSKTRGLLPSGDSVFHGMKMEVSVFENRCFLSPSQKAKIERKIGQL